MTTHYIKSLNAMGKRRKPLLDNLLDIIKLSEEEMKELGRGRRKDLQKKEDRIVNWVTEILPQ